MAEAFVKYGNDPTVYKQDTGTGQLLKAYGTWDQLLADNPSGAITEGGVVPTSQWYTDGKGGYGFKTAEGTPTIASNEGSFFQATGQNDWGAINSQMGVGGAPAAAAPAAPQVNPNFATTYGEGSQLVSYQNDPTVFVQNAQGQIVKAYGSPDQVASEYGANWQGSIQPGKAITNSVLRNGNTETASYGFDMNGTPYYFGNQDAAFQAYGTNDWNAINGKVSNVMDQKDKTGLGIASDNLIDKLDSQSDELVNYLTTGYDTEYKTLGLDTVKTSIDTLDTQINTIKTQMAADLAKVKANPGMSAAAITGDVGAMQDKYNAQIGNLIDQRNALADQYNTGVDQLMTKMGLQTEAKKTGIAATEGQLNMVSGQLQNMSDAEMAALQLQLDQEKSDRGYSIDLMNAETNAYSAETSRINATKPSSSGGGSSSTAKHEVTLSDGTQVSLSDSAYMTYLDGQDKENEDAGKTQAALDIVADIEYVKPLYDNYKKGGAGHPYSYILQQLIDEYGTWYSVEDIKKMLTNATIME